MRYQALKTLIDSDPANAGKTDAEVLTWVLDTDPSPPFNDVEWRDYLVWLGEVDGLEKLEAAIADGGATQATKAGARLALVIANSGEPLLLSDSRVRSLLAKVVPSVFTAAERNTLLAASQGTPTRWEVAGLGRAPVESHIAVARAL